ncbi:MAG: hypothetical protein ACJAT1_001160 [Marivirga sp.]|jgi:hypothetical protein
MKNLILQFTFVALILFTSCGGEPLSGRTQALYRNSSNHEVELIGYVGMNRTDSLNKLYPEEEYIWELGARKGKNNAPSDIIPFQFADYLIMIFNDTVQLKYVYNEIEGNPMRIENYALVEGQKEPYIYLFEFTNADYDRALERGRVIE